MRDQHAARTRGWADGGRRAPRTGARPRDGGASHRGGPRERRRRQREAPRHAPSRPRERLVPGRREARRVGPDEAPGPEAGVRQVREAVRTARRRAPCGRVPRDRAPRKRHRALDGGEGRVDESKKQAATLKSAYDDARKAYDDAVAARTKRRDELKGAAGDLKALDAKISDASGKAQEALEALAAAGVAGGSVQNVFAAVEEVRARYDGMVDSIGRIASGEPSRNGEPSPAPSPCRPTGRSGSSGALRTVVGRGTQSRRVALGHSGLA